MSDLDETQSISGSKELPKAPQGRPAGLPGYEWDDEVGRGGMGVVYRARDLALNREVAVKILLNRYAPDSVIAGRFVAEAQITGQLQHPGTPAVYQIGQMPDRRPFLVMKLIKGETLDSLLKSGRPMNALAVFESIAQAVGYAHAHGVIHRDLKPANVMVGPFGEIQVMDWGLAKVLSDRPATGEGADSEDAQAISARTEIIDPRDSEGSFTQAGSVMGTPAFMPPEQAAGEVGRVDRRSDVFGLGAILCALLTGEPPFTGKDADSIRLAAVRGRTEEAFARLEASGAEPDVVALCKRCLSFEPAERPADASAVASEIASLRAAADDRARQAELAQARAEVQAAEQGKRRRVVQAAALGVAAVLLLGIGGTTLGLVRADHARRDSEANERLAKEAKSRSEASLAETRAVLDFVETKVFAAAQPEGQDGGLGSEVTLRRAIESAVPSIERGFRDQPLIEARLRQTIGRSFYRLGEAETSRAMFRRALELYTTRLGPDHPDTLLSMHALADSYSSLGRQEEALALREEVHKWRQSKLGPGHPETLRSMVGLVASYCRLGRRAEALTLCEEVLRLQQARLGPDHPDTILSMRNLAEALIMAGRGAEAIPIIDDCVRLSAGKAIKSEVISFVMDLRLRHFQEALDVAGCRDTAAMWERLARADADSLYQAACMRAVTAAVTSQVPGAEAARLADEADRAMAWLRKAIAAGSKDRGQIEQDGDLDALRTRADFRELIESLPKPTEATSTAPE